MYQGSKDCGLWPRRHTLDPSALPNVRHANLEQTNSMVEPFKTPSFPNKARAGGSTCVSKNNFQTPDLKWGCIPETELSTYGLVSYKIKGVCLFFERRCIPSS